MRHILAVLGVLCLLACAPFFVVAMDGSRTTFPSIPGGTVPGDRAVMAPDGFEGVMSEPEAHATVGADSWPRVPQASQGSGMQPLTAGEEGLPDEGAQEDAGETGITPAHESAFSGGDLAMFYALEQELFSMPDDWRFDRRCRCLLYTSRCV